MFVCGILIISVPIIAFWIVIYTDADFLIILWLFLFLFRIYLFLFAYKMYWKKWRFFLEERQLFFPLRWSKGVSSLAVIIILILFVFYLGIASEFLLRGMRH